MNVSLFLLLGLLLMPAPTNISIGTAYDLGSTLPISYSQDQSDAGTTYNTWYKATIPTGVNAIGPFFYGNFGTWNPVLACWRNLSSPEQIGNSSVSKPMQIAVTPGETIYFSSTKPGGNVSPAVTTIDIVAAPALSVPTGSIYINDSTDGFPLVALSATTGTNLAFQHPFPAGESNRVLTDGRVIVADSSTNGPKIYAGNPPALVNTPTMPATGYVLYGTDQTTGWWAFRTSGGNSFAVFISNAYVVSGTVHALGAGSIDAGTPKLDNTEIYFILNTSNVNQPIKKVVLSTDTVTTWVAGDASYILRPGITTLLSGDILVGYENTGVANEVRRFNTAGVLQATYSLGAGTIVEQIFTALDDPIHFWVWTTETANGGGLNRFRKIKVSDGTVVLNLTSVQFIAGVSQPTGAADNARFGSDFSCVPWIARTGSLTTTTYPIRRERQFLLPSDPDNRTLFLDHLELLMRTGVGNSDAPDPQVMLQISRDGGKTWGNELWRSAGAVGEWKDRVRWLRLGRYRNAVVRIVVSDPVDWQFVLMMGNLTRGTS